MPRRRMGNARVRRKSNTPPPREQTFLRENDRLNCFQSDVFRRSRDVFAIYQSASTFIASLPQIETRTLDRSKKR